MTLSADLCYTAKIPLEYKTLEIPADLIVFVTSQTISGTENLKAWSTICFVNSMADNRPTVAQINIFPEKIELQALYWGQFYDTLLHEMIHILGLNPNLFGLFVDSSGVSLGIDNVVKNVSIRDSWKYAIITNKVTQAVRNHFGCYSLIGAELENEGSNSSIASHWERRVFGDELMTATSVFDSPLSNITLSFLEDTGWYYIDYSNVEEYKYGRNMGCDFLSSKCIINSKSMFPFYFTTSLNQDGCYYDFTKRGKSSVTQGIPINEFNYLNEKILAFDPFSDNCPSYTYFQFGDCRMKANHLLFNLIDQEYGADSRCFMGTFFKNSNGSFYDEHFTNSACFRSKCLLNNSQIALQIFIGNSILDCPISGGNISIPGYVGELFCPPSNLFCPLAFSSICPNQCSNQGNCTKGICICKNNYYGEDCAQEYCISSLNCSNNGICDHSTRKCDCFDGWGGRNCSDYALEYFSSKYNFRGDLYQNRCVTYNLPNRKESCSTAGNFGGALKSISVLILLMLFIFLHYTY